VLILIDESGDPGFKLDKGSSAHFIVAMVGFRDLRVAEAASRAISEVRQSVRISGEFKFNNCQDRIRDAFFDAIAPFDFQVCGLIVTKTEIYSPRLRANKELFYRYFVAQLMKHDTGLIQNATVKIDGSGDREFRQELTTYFRKQVPKEKMVKLKLVDSRRDNLIQLADMVAGAIARAQRTDRNSAERWLCMIAGKILDLWRFR